MNKQIVMIGQDLDLFSSLGGIQVLRHHDFDLF